MGEYKGVLICGEVSEQKLASVTLELLSTGHRLSDKLREPLNLLLIGQNIEEAIQEAIHSGADEVYAVEGAPFSESLPETYVHTIADVCKQTNPVLILFGQTDIGREIAPRLAAKLDSSVCLDCVHVDIDLDTGTFLQSKPVYGGNALAVWESTNHFPQIVTMRPRSSEPADSDSSRQGGITPVSPTATDSPTKVKLIETVKEELKGISLEDAKVIVAGGGGIGGKEGFELLEDLAQILRGAIGTSRVPCDEGWMPKKLEIGQTGRMVSPTLYIAVGISGAPQHLAGCSGSKCIVAINRDPDAHIFKEANFGIVGDYKEALPSIIDKLKSILSD
ncbi:electron transfer flavoprotein subunit alpha/FixB family protein [Acidobacteriota bacterium]